MTEPTYETGGPVAPTTGGGLAGAFGPEAVAAVLSIIVVVALLGSRLAFAGGTGGSPTPSPLPSATDVPTRTAPAIDPSAIGTLLSVDQNLITYAGTPGLQGELDPPPVDADAVRNLFANMNIQLVAGVAAARRLAATPAGAPVAAQLLEVYAKLGAIIETTSGVQLSSQATWQKAAKDAVVTIGLLPALDAQLRALLVADTSPSPTASLGESPAASPSVGPSATVAPTPTATLPPSSPPPATPPPSTAPPSQPSIPPPSPTPGPNAIVNPGFEQGVGSPWELRVSGSAVASIAQDGQQPLAGALSARIDISVPSPSQAFVSLQQGSLSIVAGTSYEVTVLARAAAPRQIRIRITGPNGQVLGNGTGLFQVGTSPTPLRLPMSSIVPTDAGILAIDVGGSGETVWLDDVSFSRVGGSGP